MKYQDNYPIKTRFNSSYEKLVNTLLFPYRAIIQNPNKSSASLACLRDERMINVARFCKGKVLDIGCGPGDVFNKHFLNGNGKSIDFFGYEGLQSDQIVPDPTHLPFNDGEFDTVTLIANINHIPKSVFTDEMREISRVLKPNGRLVMTRIGLIVSFMTHHVVEVQSKLSSSYYDMDNDRGMEEDERYTVSRGEIDSVCSKVGLKKESIHKIWPQWGLNEIIVYSKK